jgi:hypothetical protein
VRVDIATQIYLTSKRKQNNIYESGFKLDGERYYVTSEQINGLLQAIHRFRQGVYESGESLF